MLTNEAVWVGFTLSLVDFIIDLRYLLVKRLGLLFFFLFWSFLSFYWSLFLGNNFFGLDFFCSFDSGFFYCLLLRKGGSFILWSFLLLSNNDFLFSLFSWSCCLFSTIISWFGVLDFYFCLISDNSRRWCFLSSCLSLIFSFLRRCCLYLSNHRWRSCILLWFRNDCSINLSFISCLSSIILFICHILLFQMNDALLWRSIGGILN